MIINKYIQKGGESMPYNLIPRNWWDEDDALTFSATMPSGLSVSEDDSHVYVSAAVPGIDEKDIEVTFDKGVLWIKGQSEEKEESKKRKYYRQSTSSFAYQVAVPGDIDTSTNLEATVKNGVVTVTFAKVPASQPKKIAVKAAK